MTGVCFCLNRREEKRQSLARCSCFRTPEREREKERARFSPDVGQNFFPFFARVSFRHSSLSISNFTIRDVCNEKCQFSSKNFYKNCTIILINFKNLQDQLYLRFLSLSLIFHLYSLSLSFFYPLQLDKHTRLYSTLFLIRFYFLSFLPFNPFYSQLYKRTIYTTKLTRSRIPSPPFFLCPSLSLSLCILNVLLASPSFFLPLASPRPIPKLLATRRYTLVALSFRSTPEFLPRFPSQERGDYERVPGSEEDRWIVSGLLCHEPGIKKHSHQWFSRLTRTRVHCGGEGNVQSFL